MRPAPPPSACTGYQRPSACVIPAAPRMETGEGLVPSPGPRQWGCAARVSPSNYVTACGCHGEGGGDGPGSRMEAWRPPAIALPSLSSSPPLGVVCQTPRIQCPGLSLSVCETEPAAHGLGEMDKASGSQSQNPSPRASLFRSQVQRPGIGAHLDLHIFRCLQRPSGHASLVTVS